jgi:hypothetical protein
MEKSTIFLFLRPNNKGQKNENRSGGSHRTGRLEDASSA